MFAVKVVEIKYDIMGSPYYEAVALEDLTHVSAGQLVRECEGLQDKLVKINQDDYDVCELCGAHIRKG